MTETRTTVTVTVNGRAVAAAPGELLIDVAERAGTYIPRFCYHPRMEPVGVCRMCLVEVEGPRGATLQPACYQHVNDGMVVTTDSPKVKKAQEGVLEFLLANHPLDCPVCDKGGECPLQDQALTHGPGETRFVEEKRHFVKPIEIGPLVLLDRERCIQCARCTRFAAEVAGDTEIAFAGRGDQIEVAPSPEHPFTSVFSGNTVQICPVGALTATPYRFAARPWDLEQVESTCTQCAVGCRLAVQSSGNRLTRVLGVDSDPVNHGWLCDKGRFTLDAIDGHEGSRDPLDPSSRITSPLVRRDGTLVEATWGEALARAAELLGAARAHDGGVGVIGGAALTNESAYAWARVAREVLGTEHVDAQYGDGLDARRVLALPGATIDDACAARVVVTLCGDPREELPVLFLRLRGALARRGHDLVELAVGPSALHPLATVSIPVRPGEAHRVIDALADEGRAPADLALDEDARARARELLGDGEGVVVVAGRTNLAEDPAVVERALTRLAEALPRARFLVASRRGNVRGAIDAGLAPGLRPGRVLGAGGRDTLAQLAALREGAQRAVLVLGDLLGNVLDRAGAAAALERADVVAVTGHGGATLAHADVVLPAAVQHERTGTVTNLEGRVTAVVPKIVAPGAAWPDVAIAAELARALGAELAMDSVEDAARAYEVSTGYPALTVLLDATSEGRLAGSASAPAPRRPLDPMAFPGIRSAAWVGLGESAGDVAESAPPLAVPPLAAPALADLGPAPSPEVPGRDAYGLALRVAPRLYDHGVAVAGSPALAALVGPTEARLHPGDLDRLGLDTGGRLLVRGAGRTLELTVARDAQVPRGVLEVAFGALGDGGEDVNALADPDAVITQVKVEAR
ncbi:MAG TPA: NADH-quinone oxidoreductase subunit NuoG [Acidimicrobiales bacterium]|nr:NADH-quinone oxidoreductase subunit NuoG [Acidimicrobiales bacterium]